MEHLTRKNLNPDPIRQFSEWMKDAEKKAQTDNPDAACLSTLDGEGFPDGRIVLIKYYDEKGFIFYTNIESAKGESLHNHTKASLTFYWDSLKRQVRIQGNAELIKDSEADRYFKSRPRENQIGSWASQQSAVLEARSVLIQRVEDIEKKFKGKTIPRPPFWSGFRLSPVKIEFWQERPNRLHDRFRFTKNKLGGWEIERLYP